MAKVKYYAKENSTIGTHSFYAVPIPNDPLYQGEEVTCVICLCAKKRVTYKMYHSQN